MRLLVASVVALGTAVVAASGCGGGAGPATPPFSPFGVDPSIGSTEPAGGSNEAPPPSGGSQQSIEQLCAAACARISLACPSAAGPTCISGCVAEPATVPACVSQVQAFLACISTAPLTCSSYGTFDAPACMTVEVAVADCVNPGT